MLVPLNWVGPRRARHARLTACAWLRAAPVPRRFAACQLTGTARRGHAVGVGTRGVTPLRGGSPSPSGRVELGADVGLGPSDNAGICHGQMAQEGRG